MLCNHLLYGMSYVWVCVKAERVRLLSPRICCSAFGFVCSCFGRCSVGLFFSNARTCPFVNQEDKSPCTRTRFSCIQISCFIQKEQCCLYRQHIFLHTKNILVFDKECIFCWHQNYIFSSTRGNVFLAQEEDIPFARDEDDFLAREDDFPLAQGRCSSCTSR